MFDETPHRPPRVGRAAAGLRAGKADPRGDRSRRPRALRRNLRRRSGPGRDLPRLHREDAGAGPDGAAHPLRRRPQGWRGHRHVRRRVRDARGLRRGARLHDGPWRLAARADLAGRRRGLRARSAGSAAGAGGAGRPPDRGGARSSHGRAGRRRLARHQGARRRPRRPHRRRALRAGLRPRNADAELVGGQVADQRAGWRAGARRPAERGRAGAGGRLGEPGSIRATPSRWKT